MINTDRGLMLNNGNRIIAAIHATFVTVRRLASSSSSSLPFHLHNTLSHSSTPIMAENEPKPAKPKSKPPQSATPSYAKDEAYLQTVIDKWIRLFESIKAEQIEHRKPIGGEPIKIALPDGNVKEGKKWITTSMDISKELSKSLASSALISQVNGTLWDMIRPLEGDCELKVFTFDSDEGRDTMWHSSAHILGRSLEMVYGCKLCIGPCTTRGERITMSLMIPLNLLTLLLFRLLFKMLGYKLRLKTTFSPSVMRNTLLIT